VLPSGKGMEEDDEHQSATKEVKATTGAVAMLCQVERIELPESGKRADFCHLKRPQQEKYEIDAGLEPVQIIFLPVNCSAPGPDTPGPAAVSFGFRDQER